MLESILEYQKKDAQLVAIEREITDSKAKKVVNQMADFVKSAQQKLVVIEKNAAILLEEYQKLYAEYQADAKVVDGLSKQKFETLTKEELKNYEKEANELVAKMLVVEKNIATLSHKIKDTLTEFEKTKAQGMQAKQRHTQGLTSYNQLVKSKQTEIEKLKKELVELECKTDKKLLAKYQKMRDDKKFPVFVPLNSNSCGGCSMELPSSQLNKIDENGMLECENCHRIIYIPKGKK